MAEIDVPCRHDRTYRFEPERTALLVIDMQRYFLDGGSDASEGSGSGLGSIIPLVVQLVGWARQVGCRVVHTREAYRPDLSDVTAVKQARGYVGKPGPEGRALIRGEPNHDFVAALRPEPGEVVIDKPGFSAFHRSDLHQQLAAVGVDHLILCGVTTQCCVHSTLRSAVDLGYWCLTVADCCAAEEQDLHDAALRLIAGEGHLFGWICTLSDLPPPPP